MSWFDIVKNVPFPNEHVGNRKKRGGRKILVGTGPMKLFRYDELHNIHSAVKRLVDFNYRLEIEKRLKKETDEEVRISVIDELEEQKRHNVYATNYGSYTRFNFMSGEKTNINPNTHDWFAGRFNGLGYNPDNADEMREAGKTLQLTGRHWEWFHEDRREEE
tara:strand:- start:29 stop:514 length:486 start_codon:yes stop_codon:yes gene_type:complete